LAAAKTRAEALGVRTVLSIDTHRAGDDTVSAVHLHPADTGGALFSFEQADPPDSWAYAGEAWRDYRRGDVVSDIVGVEITSPQPQRLIDRLSALLNTRAEQNVLHLEQSALRITAAPGAARDKFVAIDFAATARARAGERHEIAGVMVRFV